ncbi:MAG: MFS transporter [Deltaproteobacteria bacterium]|nr:MFS transporter [Deltaproteobacteria bacterium]
MENKHTESKYRWYVLGLAALTLSFCMAMPHICMPVLFNEISADIGLSLVQIGWIWGFFPMSGLFIVFVAGLLADRFGSRRILILACATAGLAGASRGLSNSFYSLLLTTFIFGLLVGFMPSNAFKAAATWFPSEQRGLASGILMAGMGAGFTISSMLSATLLSPMLGSWRRVLFLYGGISILIALLWLTTVKERRSAGKIGAGTGVKPRDAIYNVLRNKNVWLISLATMCYHGCIQGMCGYLPFYLRESKGWLPASADGTLAAFTGVSTLGAVPISLLSDKFGRRKLLVLSIITVAIIGVGLLSVAEGFIVWAIIIMVGIGRDALIAMVNAANMDSKGIGSLYSGTAVGFLQTISRIGAFLSPPIGNSVAVFGESLPFTMWAALSVVAFLCFSFTGETAHREE